MRHRRNVGDGDINGRGFRYAAAGDGIGKAVSAVKARVRGIAHLAVFNRHRAVIALGDGGNGIVAVAESVVRQHVDDFRHARVGGGVVVNGVRDRIVLNGERRCDAAVIPAVRCRVGHHRYVAVPVSHRNKRHAAVRSNSQASVPRQIGRLACLPGGTVDGKIGHRHGVAVGVAAGI